MSCAPVWTGQPRRRTMPPMPTRLVQGFELPPLYLFGGDQSADDVNGQGVNACGVVWWAVSPAGDQVTTKPSSGSTGGY